MLLQPQRIATAFDRFVRPRCPNSTVWSFSQDQLVQIQEERRDVAVASSWRVAGLKKTMKHSMNGIRIPKGGRIHSCWVGGCRRPAEPDLRRFTTRAAKLRPRVLAGVQGLSTRSTMSFSARRRGGTRLDHAELEAWADGGWPQVACFLDPFGVPGSV